MPINTTIHFALDTELNNSLSVIKQEYFFNKSRSEMIRVLLTAGIEAYRKRKRSETTAIAVKPRRNVKTNESFKYTPLIKRYREDASMPISALSQIMDMPEDRYRSIEDGTVIPTKEEWKDIREILGIEV